MDFAYGQGSVFSGFATGGDLDIVIVWRDDEVPDEARRLSDPGSEPTKFRGDWLCVGQTSRLGMGGGRRPLPPGAVRLLVRRGREGDGWQEHAWPQPLHAVAGLAVKDGIEQMLEQLDLTDDEREALEGDRDAVAALAERLADTPTPAGPTPNELGGNSAFVALTAVRESLRVPRSQPDGKGGS